MENFIEIRSKLFECDK